LQSLSDLPTGSARLLSGPPKLSLPQTLEKEQAQLSQPLLAGQVLGHPGDLLLSLFQFINVFPELEALKVDPVF